MVPACCRHQQSDQKLLLRHHIVRSPNQDLEALSSDWSAINPWHQPGFRCSPNCEIFIALHFYSPALHLVVYVVLSWKYLTQKLARLTERLQVWLNIWFHLCKGWDEPKQSNAAFCTECFWSRWTNFTDLCTKFWLQASQSILWLCPWVKMWSKLCMVPLSSRRCAKVRQ